MFPGIEEKGIISFSFLYEEITYHFAFGGLAQILRPYSFTTTRGEKNLNFSSHSVFAGL